MKLWNTKPIFSRRTSGSSDSLSFVMSEPDTVTVPLVGLSRAPAIVRNVVLPAPEGPMISTTSPAFAWKVTSSSAFTAASPAP